MRVLFRLFSVFLCYFVMFCYQLLSNKVYRLAYYFDVMDRQNQTTASCHHSCLLASK